MSPNRKADLQRKLAMAPIPKPPAGLAERIKSDIPEHLLVDVRKERERLSRSVSFNMRVAASIILLIGSVYLALHVMTRAAVEKTADEMPANVVRAPQAAAPAPVAAPARVAEAVPPQPAPVPKTLPVQQAAAPKKEPERERVEERVETKVAAGGRAADIAPPEAPPVAAPPPPQVMADGVTVGAAAPENRAAAMSAAPRAAAKSSGGFMAEANAAPLALTPSTLFDIPVPHGAAERGPMLIQSSAAPASAPRALRVDSEAATLGDKTLLRVSVDTPNVAHVEGGSLPPLGADATLDVDFDENAVVAHKALSGAVHASESVLPSGASVTALYDVELKPGVGSRAAIATVTLRYRAVSDGKEHVVRRKLRVSDVRTWENASKRMKSTSLGAALVYGFEPAESIAEKARAAGLDSLAALAERH